MNKSSILGFKLYISYRIYLLFLLIFVFSCQKTENVELSTPQDELLTAAKGWFNDQLELTPGKPDLDLKSLRPQWEKPSYVINNKKQKVIGVTLLDKDSIYMELNVIKIDDYVYGTIKKYTFTSEGQKLDFYTGTGQMLLSGKYSAKTRMFIVPKKDIKLAITTPDIYKTMDASMNTIELEEVNVFGGGGAGGGVAPGDVGIGGYQPVPSGGNPYTPSFPSDPVGTGGNSNATNTLGNSVVHNDLSNSCLKELLNQLLNTTLKVRILNILKNFQANEAIDFDFVDGSGLSNDFFGYFNPDASTGSRYQIELNPDLLPKASKELTTIVIFHESVHAFLQTEGKQAELQHSEMAIKYTGLLAQSLVDLYGTPLAEAKRLSWLGLMGTQAWELNKNTLSQGEINDIANTINSHKNGSSGTKYCN